MPSELSYIAAPYSHKDKNVIEQRMQTLLKADADLTVRLRKITVTPLSKHFILPFDNIPGDWGYWEQYSKHLLNQCKEMIIIGIPGWDTSTGVAGEIEYACKLGIPVYLYNIETKEILEYV